MSIADAGKEFDGSNGSNVPVGRVGVDDEALKLAVGLTL